jgi:hypothetical protein
MTSINVTIQLRNNRASEFAGEALEWTTTQVTEWQLMEWEEARVRAIKMVELLHHDTHWSETLEGGFRYLTVHATGAGDFQLVLSRYEG